MSILLSLASSALSGKVKLPPGHPNTGKCNFRVTARDSYGLVSEPVTENLNVIVSHFKLILVNQVYICLGSLSIVIG